MAALDDDALRKLTEQLARLRYSTELTSDTFETFVRTASRDARAAAQVANMYERTMESIRYTYREQISTNEKLRKDFELMRTAVRVSSQSETNKARKLMEIDVMAAEIRNQALGEVMGTTLKTLRDFTISISSTLLKNMQSGASGIQMAGSLMSQSFDLITSSGSQVGKGLQTLGTALMLTPKTFLFGALVTGIGFFAEKTSQATKKIAEIALPLLQAEVEKSNAVFLTMSQSGALFANGIEDMRKAAHAAQLTLTQLAAVVKEKAPELASLGISTTGAVRVLSRVLELGGQEFQKNLYKLGFNFEQQAAMVADTMADMRQAGTARLIPEDVIKNVNQYAENVRILTNITGEDIKKRREEARTAAAQLAFQQKLAGLDENTRVRVVEAMEAMDAQQRKNFMESVVFGQVINREGAILESLIPAYREANQESLAALREGTLNLQRQTEIQARRGPDITRGLLEQGGTIGVAGLAGVGGLVGNLNTLMAQMVQYFKRFTPDAEQAARDAVTGQRTAQGLTDTLANIQIKGQALAITFEQNINPLLGQYALVLDMLLNQTVDIVNFIEKQLGRFLSPGPVVDRRPPPVQAATDLRRVAELAAQEAENKARQSDSVEDRRRAMELRRQADIANAIETTSRMMEARRRGVVGFPRPDEIPNQPPPPQPAGGPNEQPAGDRSTTPQNPGPRSSVEDTASRLAALRQPETRTPTTLSLGLVPGSEEQRNFIQAMALAFNQSLGTRFDELITGQLEGNQIASDTYRNVRNLG